MGCYDFFKGTCPKCGRHFESQTKWTGDRFNVYTVGDKVPVKDVKLQVKESCECGTKPVVHIKDGVLVRFSVENPDEREGLWGAALDKGESEESQFKKEIKKHGD